MKATTKWISLLLALIIALSVCSSVPFTVSAAEADPAAQSQDDYPEIKLGETLTVSLEDEYDEVCLKFVPEKDMMIRFYSTSDLDPVGSIEGWYETPNTWSEVSEYDDDSGKDRNFKIVCKVFAADSSYTFKVRMYSGGGSVNVTVEELSNEWDYDLNDEEGVTVAGYYGSDTEVTIPSELGGMPVTEIGSSVFGMSQIDKVIIPDSVLYLSSHAFSYTDLKEVVFGNNVRRIGYSAFRETGLTEVNIPASVTHIDGDAFAQCRDLTRLTVSPDNTKYDSREDCNAIVDSERDRLIVGCSATVIPDTVKSIGESAFDGISTLTEITIPDSVTEINSCAFQGTGLTTITIPDSVTAIGGSAFQHNYSLETVTLGNSVMIIDNYAFAHCYALQEAVIPDSVIGIGENAFYRCSSLQKLTVGNSVKRIGQEAFLFCGNLTGVTLPASINRIGEMAFGYTDNDNWETVPVNGFTVTGYTGSAAETYAEDNDFPFVSIGETDSSDEYPEIMLGETVPVLVYGSEEISYLKYEAEADGLIGFHASTYAMDTTGYIFDADMNELYQSGCGRSDWEDAYYDLVYEVEAGKTYYLGISLYSNGMATVDVTLVERDLYDYEEYDTSVAITRYYGHEAEVVIPEKIAGKPVTRIGYSAFSYNDSIERVVLSDQIYNVSSYAFDGCRNLREVVFPSGFETISYCAFLNCPNLKSVTLPLTVYYIDSYGFGYVENEDYEWEKIDDFTIYGYTQTEAERYAEREGFTFVALHLSEYTASLGERLTAPQGTSIYRFTPEKDMAVYYHAIGESGAFCKRIEDYYSDYKRNFVFFAEAGKTYSFYVNTKEKVDADADATYDGTDFAFEEIPITDTKVGTANTFTYRSPLKFADVKPDMDILYPYMGHSAIATMPLEVIRFTAPKAGWVSMDLKNDGIIREEMELTLSDFSNMRSYDFGGKTAGVVAGTTYFLTVYSSEIALKNAVGIPYQVTVNKKEFKRLKEGHNTITQAPGSEDDFYEFECPVGGWWTFSVPEGINKDDIDLRYYGGVAGFYFELNRTMQIMPFFRDMIFKVAANDTAQTKTFDFEISMFHFPEIKLNETKQVTITELSSYESQLEFVTDKPRLVEITADASLNNGSGAFSVIRLDTMSSGGLRTELQDGINKLRFFAEPGVIYIIYPSYYNENNGNAECSLNFTLKDVSDEIEEISVGETKRFSAEGNNGSVVYRFTPSVDCTIKASSTAESPLYLCTEGKKSVTLASPDYSGSRTCVAGKTYYLYYESARYEIGEAILSIGAKSVPIGDADGDGEVSVMDASAIQRDLSSLRSDMETELASYLDIDKNNVVDIADVTYILRAVAGIEIPYPIG